MTTIFTAKKKSKMSMKYFLRKDYFSDAFLNNAGNESPSFQLYIDFVFRRGTSRCKSLWMKFVQTNGFIFNNLNDKFYAKSVGYGFSGISEKVFSSDVQNFINGKSSTPPNVKHELIDFLKYEKYHYEALFDLFREVEVDKFDMSKFGSEYKNTILFVTDLFQNILKEHLQKEFFKVLPNFPQIFSDERTTLQQLGINMMQILSLVERHNLNNFDAFRNYPLLLTQLLNASEEYLCFSNKDFSPNGMTLPIWFAKNHSASFYDFLINRLCFLDKDELTICLNLLKLLDNQLIIRKKELMERFI